MFSLRERADENPERLWAGTVGALLVALVGGSLIAPETVYDGFIWHYFWGPVQADAHNAVCAIRPGSTVEYLYSSSACQAAAEPVAYPGYTVVSEIGYIVSLLLTITGVVMLLERLGIGQRRGLFWAMVPFMLLGGALRTVEDAHNAIGDSWFDYPLNTLLISPIIYFTIFVIALACILAALGLSRQGYVDRYEYPLGAMGAVAFLLSIVYLSYLAATESAVTFYPLVLIAMVGLSAAAAAATWYAIEAVAPEINEGTGLAGAMVLVAHAVDGAANVIGLDYLKALGVPYNLNPKHPANQFIVDFFGAAWPFLVVKMAAATFLIWVFEPDLVEETPRYTTLLLIAVSAVGLGPGSRDLLRSVFGV
ncbi:DUF63 family protein [Halolamina sp. CBA1230]|uniref:DUF63 family protein n=1 Tax=Halolamina sp. CBA1230 TaxID=1853690 RepID=UPI0009A2152B|nr:DUF63 family protein [Halolamina sp. CBA1230]QKY19831.1 DUF63 family protein [Halolamina sp. CBA1230]